jgi:hypothetical protein
MNDIIDTIGTFDADKNIAKVSGRKTSLHESKWAFSGRVTRKDRGLPETYEEELAKSWLWGESETKTKESGRA